MANDGFNGTTIGAASFNSMVSAPLVSLQCSETCADVDVTGSTDTQGKSVPGIPRKSLDVTIVGTCTEAAGTGTTTGTFTITFNDGTTDVTTGVALFSKTVSGALDDKITTALNFKPTR